MENTQVKPTEQELLEYAITCCYEASRHINNIPQTIKCEVNSWPNNDKEYNHTFCKKYEIDLSQALKRAEEDFKEEPTNIFEHIKTEVTSEYMSCLWKSWQFIHDYLDEHEKVKELTIILPLQCTTFWLNRITFKTVFAFEFEEAK